MSDMFAPYAAGYETAMANPRGAMRSYEGLLYMPAEQSRYPVMNMNRVAEPSSGFL